ncbi:hypothetical protein QJS10_CPA16g00154 [Acorus calamus]|uniref:UBX domain-containing protein n=1 Tax=Acorus calamus TaxID=4465 RepID=A0AAV9D0Q0_ACOCL|nr:hypothetical protein QJS10_CPA16g00154 [Acorus calamus]
MEGSMSSLTYKGSIAEAIAEAKRQKKLFVVYISGNDEISVELEQSVWTNPSDVESILKFCVFVHLLEGSVGASQFSAIYPQNSVPSISVVGYNGVMLWSHEGYVSARNFIESIEKAWATIHMQESVATLLAGALASNKSEPSTSGTASTAEQGMCLSTDSPSPRDKSLQVPDQQQDAKHVEESSVRSMHGDVLEHAGVEQTISVCDADNTPPHPITGKTDSSESSGTDKVTSSERDGSSAVEQSMMVDGESTSTAVDLGDLHTNDGSKVSSGSSQMAAVVRDSTILQQENMKIDSQITADILEIADNVPRNIEAGLSLGDSEMTASETIDITQDQKVDGVLDRTNVTKKSNDVNLNIRLPDGSSLQGKFSVTDTLRSVKTFVDKNHKIGLGSYDLAVPYPRKLFDEQDLSKTLSNLGFASREALIVVPHRHVTVFHGGQSSSHNVPNTVADTDSNNSGSGYFGLAKRIISFVNPFSYFGGSSSSLQSDSTTDDGLWQYRPNPGLQNALSGSRQPSDPHSRDNQSPPTKENVGKAKNGTSRTFGSNIHTLKRDEDDPRFSDRNSFWNGNSTQYGGDNNK